MKAKILVVDDNQIFRRLSIEALKSNGFSIFEASNTIDALQVVKNSLPDLILTDILMPGLDGFELLRRLRQNAEFDQIKVIFYTGTFGDEAELKFAKEMGVTALLQKPLHPKDLCLAIEKALSQDIPQARKLDHEFDQEHLRLVTNKLSKKVEELEKANEETLLAKNFFKSLANSIPQLAWQASKDGVLIYTNERWKHYHHIFSEKVSFRDWAELVHQQDRSIFVEKMSSAIEGVQNISFEARLWNAEQRMYFTHLISAKVVQASNDQAPSWFGTCTDISLQKDYEIKQIHLKEQAEKLSRAKTEFLNNISHELRTPLNAILGFCEILQTDELNRNQLNFLGRIKSGALRLSSILEDVVSISELEAVGVTPAQSLFLLSDFVNDLVVKYQPLAQEKGLELNVKNEINSIQKILGYPSVFNRILFHLFDNAIKFTSNGVVGFRIFERTHSQDASLKSLIFEVEDTGIGIDQETRELLFKPFIQADSSLTRKHGGLGLGLLLSRKLAHSIGAELELVSSVPQSGSCFRLSWRQTIL